LLSIWLFTALRSSLMTSIGAIEQGVERVASGDMSAKIEVSGRDELNRIAANINRMQGRLRESIEHERVAADENLRVKIALDNVSTGVAIAGVSHEITYANKAAQSTL